MASKGCTKEENADISDRQHARHKIAQSGKSVWRKLNCPSSVLETSLDYKKHKYNQLPQYISVSLLLTMSLTCIGLVSFHLCFTWHLQRNLEDLQTRVELLSTLDMEDLRTQLRLLHDKCTVGMKIDLNPSVINANQVDDRLKEAERDFAARMKKRITNFHSTEITANPLKYTLLFSTKLGHLEPRNTKAQNTVNNSKSTLHTQFIKGEHNSGIKLKTRKKRQADLSSHTQDGVPIFDRGYGVLPNRTEGLRIYQSLLTNGGRNEQKIPEQSSSATDSTSLHHHRQNNLWRNKKEKSPRHRHQGRSSTIPPSIADESDFNAGPEFGSANEHDLRMPLPSTASPPKMSTVPNVEFRHSRVKISSDGSSVALSGQGDVKPWSSSRNHGVASILSMGALPHTTSQDERVSAATAPAVLTKTVTASAISSTSNRAKPSVYKVTQPTLTSEPPFQPSAQNEELISRDSVSSLSSSNKKKINKKQLRDFGHITTAIHLVADSRNSSSTNSENQVEIASRNELGLHTSWKVAPNNWDVILKTTPLIKIDGAILTVKQSGLYFIYAQVHYLDDHSTNAYEVFVNTEPFLRCVTTAFSETSFPKANTCYTAAATYLREGDKIFLRDIEPLRYSVLQPSKTFFGLIRLAPVADFS